ncbi:hypothetical protein C2G38_2186943 [Gigaspora rosea]|uniref:Uncharacterized protein n=1 Tax=Gigaspora rosea TaxID=44941 RepID=A0A397VE45_9GLOM|nr:hypothetical protein C2G38_2186943 [Gigaspora rosea]
MGRKKPEKKNGMTKEEKKKENGMTREEKKENGSTTEEKKKENGTTRKEKKRKKKIDMLATEKRFDQEHTRRIYQETMKKLTTKNGEPTYQRMTNLPKKPTENRQRALNESIENQ